MKRLEHYHSRSCAIYENYREEINRSFSSAQARFCRASESKQRERLEPVTKGLLGPAPHQTSLGIKHEDRRYVLGGRCDHLCAARKWPHRAPLYQNAS